jgi:2-keto-4-pentenoate hydratase/2-oxohepta-3-ene-1,7-dioic acid hydratase in catechol pathway
MKLVRFGEDGRERAGLIDGEGMLRDLSALVPRLDLPTLGLEGLARLAKLDPTRLPKVSDQVRLGVPFTGISKFVAIGLNYRDHAAEAGMPVPAEPIVFMKATTCIAGPDDGIALPADSQKTDWEVELGVVIGRTARSVDEAAALSHVAGYCVVNDVSERAWQIERGGTWDKGKGYDGFGPIGPWLVTPDEVPDPQARQHRDDGVRRGAARELRQPLHDAAARRRDRHRHAARRGHGHEAAAVPQARRRGDAWGERTGLAAPGGPMTTPRLRST